jgi:hypothetical protein
MLALLTDFYSVIDMGEMSIAYQNLVGKMMGTDHLENIEVDSTIILERNLKDT